MVDKVKLALRIVTNAFDSEIEDLIKAALADLTAVGVNVPEEDAVENDPLIVRAVITYCRAYFGQPDDYDRMKASYDEQKAQLQMTTGYTDWE